MPNNTTMPTISVIIPVYNAQATVARTLRSLCEQTMTDFQAILVDDGSTDDSPGILADFAWRDDRMTLIRQPNAGLAAARNTGLDAATGEFVHFLDADDWLLPNAFEDLLLACRWTALDAACGPWHLYDNTTQPLGITMPPPDKRTGLEHLLEGNRLAPHSHIIRRSRIGSMRFDTSLRVCEDYDFWLKLASTGLRWARCDRPIACYRIRPGSLSKNPRLMLDTLMQVMGRIHTDRTALSTAARASALFYATSAALDDTGRSFASARAMIRSVLPNPAAFTAAELAQAAFYALIFSKGIAPAAFIAQPRHWLDQLTCWWNTLGAEGQINQTIEELATLTIDPDRIAQTMLDQAIEKQADLHTPIVLAGALGINGRTIATHAKAKAIPLIERDDRLPDATLRTPIDPDAVVLIAPGNDEPILAQLTAAHAIDPANIIRYSTVQSTLAKQVIETITQTCAASPAQQPIPA